MKCSYCGSITTNSQETSNCPNCGAPLKLGDKSLNHPSSNGCCDASSGNTPKIKPLKFKSQTTYVAATPDSSKGCLFSVGLVIVSLLFVVFGIGAFCAESHVVGWLFIFIACCGFGISRIKL